MKSAGVTCTTLSPSLFNHLANFCIEKNLHLDFLKRIVTGGAPISRDDVARMKSVAKNAEILVLYGSTEVEPTAHIEAEEMLAETQNADSEIVEAGVNVGALDSGLQYKFIHIEKDAVYVKSSSDWSKLEVKTGEVGELIVAENMYASATSTMKKLSFVQKFAMKKVLFGIEPETLAN